MIRARDARLVVRGAIAFAAIAVATRGLAAEPLDINPGLWEVTIQGDHLITRLPPEAVAKLTPEQRSRLEQQFDLDHRLPGIPQNVRREQCIDEEFLRKMLTEPDPAFPRRPDCVAPTLLSTPRRFELQEQCQRSGSASFKVESTDQKTFESILDILNVSPGLTIETRAIAKWHWLRNDCGNVGPSK